MPYSPIILFTERASMLCEPCETTELLRASSLDAPLMTLDGREDFFFPPPFIPCLLFGLEGTLLWAVPVLAWPGT